MEKEVFIVCGGPSLKGFDFELLRDKDTIVVNKSILDVPNPNYFITVDYTFLRKIGSHKIRAADTTKVFIACLHFDYIQERNGQIVDVRHGLVYNLQDFDVIVKSRIEGGMGFCFKDFRNGLNSGYCALQLAVVLGYKKIYLLGVDMCSESQKVVMHKSTHYHGGYGESLASFNIKLEKYYEHFVTGLQEMDKNSVIQVVSLSPISRLNNLINYVDYRKVLLQ